MFDDTKLVGVLDVVLIDGETMHLCLSNADFDRPWALNGGALCEAFVPLIILAIRGIRRETRIVTSQQIHSMLR